MGCDIHLIGQRKEAEKWVDVDVVGALDDRNYAIFGFLAGVRNYHGVTPIAEARGVPVDFAYDEDIHDIGDHSFSWLTVAELQAFNYDAMTKDRRCTRQMPGGWWSGGETCEPGEGKAMTYREFLGESFFEDLQAIADAGAERIVFGFDS